MKIQLNIPHQKWIIADMFTRIQQIAAHAQKSGHELSLGLVQATPHDCARNLIASNFLKSDCDVLLSIDADVLVPENITDMITDERPVCAAYVLAPSTKIGETIATYPVAMTYDHEKGGYVPYPIKPGELLNVPVFGTGCHVVFREVFENIQKPYYKFLYDKEGIIKIGEDVAFCENVRRNGYDCWMDARFVCKHLKDIYI